MIKKTQAGSFETQSDEIIREEALKIARATHTPGQTKEQTKLIAKGIAKGIAEYKKQEKVKQRDRARLRKNRTPVSQHTPQLESSPVIAPECTNPEADRLPGLTASGIFLLAGLLHWVRVVTGITLTIGTFPVPASWSGIAGVVALILAAWIYRSTRKSGRARRTETL
ncbi:MAG: DUF2956 family protein [Methylococcales bacterium]